MGYLRFHLRSVSTQAHATIPTATALSTRKPSGHVSSKGRGKRIWTYVLKQLQITNYTIKPN